MDKMRMKILGIVAVLSMVLLFGFIQLTDEDSSGTATGDVKDGSIKVGEYTLASYKLTIEATTPPVDSTSVQLPTLDASEKAAVTDLVIIGFTKDLSTSFDSTAGYTNLRNITYQGNTSPNVGKWYYNFFDSELTIQANTSSDITPSLTYFEMQSSVERVYIVGFTTDLSSMFTSYTNLDGNIYYKGTFGTNGGLWTYEMKTQTLTVERSSSSTATSPGGFNSDNAPFKNRFFASDVLHAVYKDYTNNSSYLFCGLDSLRTLRATDYTDYTRSGILNSSPSALPIEELYYDTAPAVSDYTASPIKTTLRVLSAPHAKSVASNSFQNGYTALTTVYLPEVTTVGQYAFSGSSSLVDVTLSSADTIERDAFYSCSALRNISLPYARVLEEEAFYNCSALETVSISTLLSTTANLGTNAFRNCTELTAITLGANTTVGENAFRDCRNLNSITASKILTIDLNAFRGCSSLSGSLEFTYLTNINSNINDYPFRGCVSLEEISLPSIIFMGQYAFYGCSGLESVTIGGTITALPQYSFAKCTSLDTVSLSGNIETLGDHSFEECTSLTYIDFPDGVRTIGISAFAKSGLMSLHTNKVQSIGESAFEDTKIEAFIAGTELRTIGKNAFKGSLLTGSVIFTTKLETIGESAFASLPITSVTFNADQNATTFITIGKNAFSQCDSLTTVTMNDRVTVIGEGAFDRCYMLTTLHMSSKIQSIGQSAFNDCVRLTSIIEFPATLNEIGEDAFANSSINGVVFNADCPLSIISAGAFNSCRSLNGTLIIPRNVITIGDSAFYNNIALDELQFVSGARITAISTSAFNGCTSLTGIVSFPSSLASIGDNAFRLTALTGITFNATTSYLATIGDNSFRDCSELTGVLSLPNRLTTIGQYAFSGCGLTSVILGQGTTSLGNYAFANNTSMRYVVIPNVANSTFVLSTGLFQNCPLEEIHISSSVTEIKGSAFDYTPEVSKTINIWFNGSMNNITFNQNCLKFTSLSSTTVTVNVHADASSETKCNSLISSHYALGMTSLNYVKESSARVDIQEKLSSAPVFTTYYAIYGGKIVLPYVRVSDTYSVAYFAVKDSYDNLLAMYASDDDYVAEEVAGSGQIVPMYPIGSTVDSIGLDYSFDRAISDNGFIRDMTITTDSSGILVDITSQPAYYGKVVTVPSFLQSSTIITSELYFVRADTLSYQLDKNTTSIRAGYYFDTIILIPEQVMVTVTFISRGVQQDAQVLLLSPFEIPAELDYMQVPEPGYTFGGWWSAEGGRGIRANDNTRFSDGQVWYAYFTPNSYTVTMVCYGPTGVTFDPWVMTGPYTIHRVSNSLYYTDATHTSNTLMFDGSSVPGWHVETYEDVNNPGALIGENYGPLTRALNIDMYMGMNSYSITLRFATVSAEIPSSYEFTINNWTVSTSSKFHTGDVINGISYAMIENGLIMPAPISQDYAFITMTAGNTEIVYENGRYMLYLDNFEGNLSTTITYTMEAGLFTIMFDMDDDTDTSFTYQHAIHVGESFTMPSVTPRYSKSGYEFGYLVVDGVSGTYVQRQSVALTDEMALHADWCVVTVRAVWTPLDYTITFDMGSYTGTVEPFTGMHEGDVITMPVITDYPGHSASGWHWFKNTTVSDPFTVSAVLTKEIIDTYSDDGRNININVDWAIKTYTLRVDPTARVYNEKTVTYGEYFSLWTCIDERSYMRFLGWSIGDVVYSDASFVQLDDNMAAAGDMNHDIIVFGLSWTNIQYRIQYDLNGGDGTRPHDEGYYIVNYTPLTLPADTGEFYKYGYAFKGWTYSLSSPFVYENEHGIFESVLADNSENEVVTFYAIWLQKSYKIAYDLDGGRQGPSAPTNVMYGDSIVISNPSRVGYEFLGWTATGLTEGAMYRSASGFRLWDGASLVRSEAFMDLCGNDGGTVIMYANWGQAEYTVSYNYNGGTGVVVGGQMQIKIGEVIELPTFRDAYKNGYTYVGWGVDTVNALAPGTVLVESMVDESTDNTLVLYAVWNPISYEVKYRYTTDYDYNTIVADFSDTVYIPLLDRSGFSFRGWTIAGAGSDAYYSKDGNTWYRIGSSTVDGLYFKNLSSTNSGIVTMDAEWTANEYRISYNANGGTGKPPVDSNTYKVGDPVTMKDYKSLIGTNGNKTVVGWSLEISGTAVNITEFTQGLCNVADATNTVNFYAVWVDDMCLVVVDLEGASVSSIPAGWSENADGTYQKLVNYGSSTKEVMSDWDDVTLSKNGYSFSGWEYTDSLVLSTVNVTPTFEKVNTGVVYIFAGVIGAFAVGAIVITRL